MAQPDPYNPAHEFLTDEGQNPLFPGSELDIEFNELERITDEILANLALIQRSDGALVNGIVTADALDTTLAAALGDIASIAEVEALIASATASAAAAAASQTAAGSSATSASTSASTATTQASNAATSATNAATSATAAANASAAVAFKFTWSTDTTNTDPTTGKVKVNAAPGSATALYISETDANGNGLASEIARWDDATNVSGKSRIKIAKDATNFLLLTITSAITDNGTWDAFTVTGASLTGTLSNGDTVYLQPVLNGSDGSGTISGSLGGTDNLGVRADGVGGLTLQAGLFVNDDSGNLFPNTTDVGALGTTTKMWADLFLASGAVINFNNGNLTITHTAGVLTLSGALSLGTSNPFTCGTIELGAAADTTLARVAAGVASIEGQTIGYTGYTTTATAAGTTTLTVASTRHQYFTGSSTQTVVLPVTSTLTAGTTFKVINNSTGNVTVQSSGANNILVMGPGSEAEFVCILTSGTTAASWSALTRYQNVPINSQSAAYTTVISDAGKCIFHPSADTTARTFTIDSNANVAYPVGTVITFVNQISAGVVTIAITTDTMYLAGAGTTGSRTLAAHGVATAIKMTSTAWIISGTGLT